MLTQIRVLLRHIDERIQATGRARLDHSLAVGRGYISRLYSILDLPRGGSRLRQPRVGEVHQMMDTEAVLSALDEIEGYRPAQPEASLYTRAEMPVTFDDGHVSSAWVYLYNAPLGKAQRIVSGDYLQHLNVR